MVIDLNAIQKILPHRYPFLFVDKVIEIEEGVKAVGLKNLTINEPFFQGHFPGNPVMPGVLVVEAMAQTAGILAYISGVRGNSIFFMSIEKAKFRKPVLPGDQLRLEIKLLHKRQTVCRFEGHAYVNNTLVAEAEFTAMVTDKEM